MFKEKTWCFFWLCFCLLTGVFAGTDAVKSESVMEGDSVSLNTGLTEIQKGDVIIWKFDSTRIAKINKDLNEISTYDDVLDGRFRDRLKLDHQTGSLTITHTKTTDSGLYEVTIRGSKTTFNVTVYAASTTDPPRPTSHPTSGYPSGSPSCFSSGSSSRPSGSTSGPPDSLIVWISAAAAGSLLLIVAVVIFFICRKHRKTDQQAETREEEITYADPTFYKRNQPKMEDEVVYASVVPRR